MHIVHYTSAHPWTSTRIFSKMCVHLAALGHQVSLVAVDRQAKDLSVFDRDGVQVHLLPGAHIKGRLARATQAARATTRYAVELNPDVMQFHDPELIPYCLLGVPRRIPVIFDSHENFVDQIDGKHWARGWRRPVLKSGLRLVRAAINWRATHILTATGGVRKDYVAAKSTVIRNLPILDEINTSTAMPLAQRPREVCYIGAISRARGIAEMIDALALAGEVGTLHLAGRFSDNALEQEMRARPGWSKVTYHGFIDRVAIADLLGRVRLGLVLLHPTPNHIDSIPIKMLEYLCAGVPTLASDFEYWHTFVFEGQTGRLIDPTDTHAIAEALIDMTSDDAVSHFAQHMTPDVRMRFSWAQEVRLLDRVYHTCIAKAAT